MGQIYAHQQYEQSLNAKEGAIGTALTERALASHIQQYGQLDAIPALVYDHSTKDLDQYKTWIQQNHVLQQQQHQWGLEAQHRAFQEQRQFSLMSAELNDKLDRSAEQQKAAWMEAIDKHGYNKQALAQQEQEFIYNQHIKHATYHDKIREYRDKVRNENDAAVLALMQSKERGEIMDDELREKISQQHKSSALQNALIQEQVRRAKLENDNASFHQHIQHQYTRELMGMAGQGESMPGIPGMPGMSGYTNLGSLPPPNHPHLHVSNVAMPTSTVVKTRPVTNGPVYQPAPTRWK